MDVGIGTRAWQHLVQGFCFDGATWLLGIISACDLRLATLITHYSSPSKVMLLALLVLFGVQAAVTAVVAGPPNVRCALRPSYFRAACTHSCNNVPPLALLRTVHCGVAPTMCAFDGALDEAKPKISVAPKGLKSSLPPGPVLLSWATGFTSLALQAHLTDGAQLDRDAAALFSGWLADPAAQHAALYAALMLTSLGSSFLLMPVTFPAISEEVGTSNAPIGSKPKVKVIPQRMESIKQHPLGAVDYSYIALNSLCMPGIFYHFICLMRSWGLDLNAPPLYNIYPSSPMQLVTETLPQGVGALALYFVTFELVYYGWHRAMHEVPLLYKWVHKQ